MNIKRFFSKTVYFIRRYLLRLPPKINAKNVPERPKINKKTSNKPRVKKWSPFPNSNTSRCYWNNNEPCPAEKRYTGTAYSNELANSLSCCKYRQSVIYSEYALWFDNLSKTKPLYKVSNQQLKRIEKTLERYKANNPEEYQMVVDKVHQDIEVRDNKKSEE